MAFLLLLIPVTAWSAPPVGWGIVSRLHVARRSTAGVPATLPFAVAAAPGAGAAISVLAAPPELPPAENAPAGGGLIVPDIADAFISDDFVLERGLARPVANPKIKRGSPLK